MSDVSQHPAAKIVEQLHSVEVKLRQGEALMAALGIRLSDTYLEMFRLMGEAAALGLEKRLLQIQLNALGVNQT
jgi:hypothetical protein